MKLSMHKKKITVNKRLSRKYVMMFISSIEFKIGWVTSTYWLVSFAWIETIAFLSSARLRVYN
jgi:hypothetical protein